VNAPLQIGDLVRKGWRLGSSVQFDHLPVTKPAAGDANHTAAAAMPSTLCGCQKVDRGC
jgi:hypothetical protein